MHYGYRILSAYFQSHPELNICVPEASTGIFMETIIEFILSQEIRQGKHTMPMAKERLIESLIRCILGKSSIEKLTDY